MAAVYPLEWLVRQVAPGAEVVALATGGAEAHGLELSPGQRRALESADVVAYLGDIDFQPQVEEAAALSAGQVVNAADVLGEDQLRHAAAHDHDDGEEDADAVDPHFWFDPTLVAQVAGAVGEAFAAADPAGADAYREAADRVAAELATLAAELDELLGDCAHAEAIVSHEAYAYLLEPRGLDQHGIAGTTPEAGGSPAELARLTDEIRAEGIPAVLAEPIEGRGDAEALAAETGVELLEIDPLESAPADQPDPGYPERLRQQAAMFARALDCAGGR